MNNLASPPSNELLDKDGIMRRVAREVAMDLYTLDQILENCNVEYEDFTHWKDHPQFQRYLVQFKDEWNAAANTHERTKIKAGIVMEEFMEEAFRNLHNTKQPLNHRVELGKLVAKIAGMGEPRAVGAVGGSGPAFSLSINIGPSDRVTIRTDAPKNAPMPAPKVIDNVPSVFEDDEDDYDPFSYPDTLEDE